MSLVFCPLSLQSGRAVHSRPLPAFGPCPSGWLTRADLTGSLAAALLSLASGLSSHLQPIPSHPIPSHPSSARACPGACTLHTAHCTRVSAQVCASAHTHAHTHSLSHPCMPACPLARPLPTAHARTHTRTCTCTCTRPDTAVRDLSITTPTTTTDTTSTPALVTTLNHLVQLQSPCLLSRDGLCNWS